jgi:hypothetical protein
MASVEIKGGEELQRRLAEIARGLTSATELRVGFLSGSTEADGTSIPMLAAIHNWGAPAKGIPPRPFFSNMVEENQAGWADLVAEGLKRSDGDAKRALEFAGQVMTEQLQAAIISGGFAPLKPATVARKGFATPLIDTGSLLASVGSEVT